MKGQTGLRPSVVPMHHRAAFSLSSYELTQLVNQAKVSLKVTSVRARQYAYKLLLIKALAGLDYHRIWSAVALKKFIWLWYMLRNFSSLLLNKRKPLDSDVRVEYKIENVRLLFSTVTSFAIGGDSR